MYLSKKLVAAIVAVVAIAAGTTAFAAIPDGGGVIHGCYDKQSGTLRVTDTDTNSPKGCSGKEATLAWNQQGPQGIPGPKGDPGPSHSYVTDAGGLITATSNFGTTVASRSLPNGTYVLSATLTVKATGLNVAPEVVHCALTGADPGNGSWSDFGWATVSSNGSGPVDVASIALDGWAFVKSGNGLATVSCDAPQQANAYFVRIIATQVGGID